MRIVTSILAITLALGSCKKYDFGDININPNPQVNAVPSTAELFTNISRQIAGDLTISDAVPGLYVQYFTETQYPGASLYSLSRSDWSTYYTGILKDMQEIIEQNTNANTAATARQFGPNVTQIAVARIMKAYTFSIVTDRWGDVPYFEALKGISTPKYDKQSAIYADLFKELTEAVAQFEGTQGIQGELLFGGDPVKWKRFANSLRMRLAMRISLVDPAKARTEFLAAYNDQNGWIDENTENAAFPYLNNRNFRNPWNAKIDQRDDLAMSNVFVDTLNTMGDRRITKYANPTPANTFVGAPYGWSQSAITNWGSNNQYSRIGAAITNMDAPGYMITAAEMHLIKAEAALRGWIAASEISAYYTAIQLSWQQWNVFDQAAYTAYIASPRVNIGMGITNFAEILRKIGLQKWIALYPNGQEAWSEWRRLHVPTLSPARDAPSGRRIPLRMGYPGNEPTLNGANYNSQVATMPGGDTPDTPVWWDK
ncbi:SusD/RagB family nutrient-binding outer membrane lipoprotein [Aridibaculum aurantiacum]|uniref:SusD/RagB family nutrient-binding outer membrane lipoprotein n=1 Tax=Aridibaculum aurantiacum TaxID=2810307 RepID=UPI001A96C553|nr:SusD/RagB family nutrient-binding outer membrane lipoprotein [Aridibaculum aurantiacum]